MSQIKIDMTVYDSIETKLMAAHPAYRSKDPEIKRLLKLRKKMTKVLFEGIEPSVDTNYFCETCGSHSHLVVYEEEQADNIIMIKKPKYEMISSHTARRTFVTNMIKNNVERNRIMKCTGHKSSASFDSYDRMTLVDNARALAGNGYLAS